MARDDPVAHDALRRARPELPADLVSPRSEAAQALLEEILSMPITGTDDTDDTDPVDLPPVPLPRSRARRPRRAFVAAAALAAFAAAAAVAIVVVGDDAGRGSDTVEVVPATPEPPATEPPAPQRSGRLDVTWRLDWGSFPGPADTVAHYEFADDDLRLTNDSGEDRRQVDGRAYAYLGFHDGMRSAYAGDLPPEQADAVLSGEIDWSEVNPFPPGPFLLDPATLLGVLAPAGPFAPLDGSTPEVLSAASPAGIEVEAIHLDPYFIEGTVTAIDATVDADGVVHRLVVTRTGTEQGEPWTETWTMEWSDLGEPITIEAPEPAEVLPPATFPPGGGGAFGN